MCGISLLNLTKQLNFSLVGVRVRACTAQRAGSHLGDGEAISKGGRGDFVASSPPLDLNNAFLFAVIQERNLDLILTKKTG